MANKKKQEFSLFDFCRKNAEKVCVYGEESLDDEGNIIPFIEQAAILTHYLQLYRTNVPIIDLFAGIGEFRLGRKEKHPEIKCKVVGCYESGSFVSELFDANHHQSNGKPYKNWGDITKINLEELPDFDMFMGGIQRP